LKGCLGVWDTYVCVYFLVLFLYTTVTTLFPLRWRNSPRVF